MLLLVRIYNILTGIGIYRNICFILREFFKAREQASRAFSFTRNLKKLIVYTVCETKAVEIKDSILHFYAGNVIFYLHVSLLQFKMYH